MTVPEEQPGNAAQDVNANGYANSPWKRSNRKSAGQNVLIHYPSAGFYQHGINHRAEKA